MTLPSALNSQSDQKNDRTWSIVVEQIRAVKARFQSYIAKPIESTVLIDSVLQLLKS